MSIELMKDCIVKRYGPFIKGKPVSQMSDGQVFAIYNRLISQPEKPNKIKGQIRIKNYI